MAKRKLSPDQRMSLREDLKKALADKRKPAEILKATAEKYGISTITARWYLNSLNGRSKGRKGKRGPGRPPNRSKGFALLVDRIQSNAMESLRKAKEARRLVPRLEALVSRETSLRREVARLDRKLTITTRKAAKLRRIIDQLVSH